MTDDLAELREQLECNEAPDDLIKSGRSDDPLDPGSTRRGAGRCHRSGLIGSSTGGPRVSSRGSKDSRIDRSMAHLTTNAALLAARRVSPLRFLAAIGDARSSFRRQFQPDRAGDIRIIQLKHIEPVDEDAACRETLPPGFVAFIAKAHELVQPPQPGEKGVVGSSRGHPPSACC
jgi:hypothetical protein